jgi:hypothetical protein
MNPAGARMAEAAQAMRPAAGAPVAAERGTERVDDRRPLRPGRTGLLALQQAAGNRAVSQWLEQRIRAGLTGPHDQATSPRHEATRATASRSGGEPIAQDDRAELERRLGYDLGRVRVHRGSEAAARLGARAFASGQDIWFGPGHDPSDRTLLAHELAHVIQQALGRADGVGGTTVQQAQRVMLEREADHRSHQVAEAPHTAFAPPRQLPPPRSSPSVVQFDLDQDVLRELHRLPSAEEEGLAAAERRRREDVISGRRARLRTLFAGLSRTEADRVYERLRERRPGDQLSERFHDILAGATRQELLGILRHPSTATSPSGEGPSLQQVLRLKETVRIEGLATAQPSYLDRAFQGIASAPIGDVYTFYPKFQGGRGENGIEIPKVEFHLDADPVGGASLGSNQVYRSRAVADAVLQELRRTSPFQNVYTYYLRDGYIFPTTLSETTLPVLTSNLRRVRESDRADIRATGELAKAVLWWYVGARIPVRVGPGRAAAPAAAAVRVTEVADELVAATQGLANPGQKMLAAARQLSAMRNLTAGQKVGVILEFFNRIGFAISKVGVVDEGVQLVMYSEDSRYAFRFIKSTGEILYGKFNTQTLEYVWESLR